MEEIILAQFDAESGGCGRDSQVDEITANARGQMAQGVSLEEWFGKDVFEGKHVELPKDKQ